MTEKQKKSPHRKELNPEEDPLRRFVFRGGTLSREVVAGRVANHFSSRARSATASSVASQPKRYAILRVSKIKSMAHLAAAADHLSRDRETPNADPDRLEDNELLHGVEGAEAVRDAWRERAPDKVRKNAVHGLEYLITASPGALSAMSAEDQNQYFGDALLFLEARHGAENILSAVIHRDETSPHLQALVIPIDEKGKLNARGFIGGKETLRQIQTDFAELVADRFGLERGKELSQAKHTTLREYYALANQKPEPELDLPERKKGLLKGESADDYLRRATGALKDAYRGLKAHHDQQLHDGLREAQHAQETPLPRQLPIRLSVTEKKKRSRL